MELLISIIFIILVLARMNDSSGIFTPMKKSKPKRTNHKQLKKIKRIKKQREYDRYIQHEPPIREHTNTSIPQTPFGMYMSRADKQAYMDSPEWQSKRQLVLARDNHQCVVCGSTHNLNIHHIDYSNLGDEHLSELTVLCQLCHSSLHEELGYTREGIYEPKSVQK